MSSSKYWIRLKDFLHFNSLEKSFTPIYLELKSVIDFTIIRLPYNVYYFSLWYQTTLKIMEEDILKYSPTVMYRGTPCIKVVFNKSINSNSLYVVLIMLKKRLNVVVLHEIDQLFTASFPIHQLICSSI